MASVKSWIKAARLRTLPLAMSGIIAGSAIAVMYDHFNAYTFLLAILTATSLQVLSNFANDYGDYKKGTDNEERVGPMRSLQGGEITEKEMMRAIIFSAIFSFALGLLLVFNANLTPFDMLIFVLFGVSCILAAYFYTAGKRSYGYVGLGDFSVFVFFGLLSVVGLSYLYIHTVTPMVILPSISMGCFATGVLNLNNMRDAENDKNSNKRTIAVLLGFSGSRIYHVVLISTAWAAILYYMAMIPEFNWWNFLFALSSPLFVKDLIGICKVKKKVDYDPYLKRLSLSTLLFSVLLILGISLSYLL